MYSALNFTSNEQQLYIFFLQKLENPCQKELFPHHAVKDDMPDGDLFHYIFALVSLYNAEGENSVQPMF